MNNASSTVPSMDGTASVGSSIKYARADHVHPRDTTKANVSDVLTKTNTTAYTPTSTYHPATKGYVDGLIPANVSDLNNDSGFQTQAQVESAINSARTMVVTIRTNTINGVTSHAKDKTYAELRDAYLAGKTLLAKSGNRRYFVCTGPTYSTSSEAFIFGPAFLTTATTFNYYKITGTDYVSYHTLSYVESINDKTPFAGKVTLTYSDVGALPDSTVIPANVSDLNNDAGYQTQAQVNALIAAAGDDDTTYAISISGNVITLTGSDGNTSTATLPVYTGGVV